MSFVEPITVRHIIFDLDGTLIDSAPAILDSFEKAFIACEQVPVTALKDSHLNLPRFGTLKDTHFVLMPPPHRGMLMPHSVPFDR